MWNYLLGVALCVAVACGWLAVQVAWKRAFAEGENVADALAGSFGCQGGGECGNREACARECESEKRLASAARRER